MAKDVEIVIGAKDKASSVLKRVSQSTSLFRRETMKLTTTAKKNEKQIDQNTNSLARLAKRLTIAFAALKGAQGAFRFVGSSLGAFEEQERAVRGLTNAIELSGDVTGPTIEKHKAFASSLQQIANVGDEVTIGLMKKASMLGVSNDKLQSTTKVAIGLSSALGIDLETALKRTIGATAGVFGELNEMIPAIRNAETETEKLAIVQELAAKGLAQQASDAQTAAGAGQRLANSWGDFKEVAGQALAPIKELVASGLAVLVEAIQQAVIPAIKNLVPSGAAVASMMEKMRTTIITAVTAVEVVILNWSKIWNIVSLKMQLVATSIAETIRHYFTDVIPQYLEWFGRNWTNLLSDALSLGVTIVQNSVANMIDILARMWELVSSGFEGGFQAAMADIGQIAARNLMEGFEAKTESLPEIAARQLTRGEQGLMNAIGKMSSEIGNEYQTKLAERLKMANKEAGAGLLDGLNLEASKINKKTKQSQQASAVESRLLTQGRTENIRKEMLELLKQVVKNTKITAKNTGEEQSPGDKLTIEMAK